MSVFLVWFPNEIKIRYLLLLSVLVSQYIWGLLIAFQQYLQNYKDLEEIKYVEDLRKVSSLLEITMLLLLPCKQKLNILHYTQERKLRVCTQKLFNTPMRTAYIPLESTAIGQTSRGNVAVPLFTKQLKFFIVVLALNNLFQKQQMLLLWSLKSN